MTRLPWPCFVAAALAAACTAQSCRADLHVFNETELTISCSLTWISHLNDGSHVTSQGWIEVKPGETRGFPAGVIRAGEDFWFTAFVPGRGDCLNFQGKAEEPSHMTEDCPVAALDNPHKWHFQNDLLAKTLAGGKWEILAQFVGPVRGHRGVHVHVKKGTYKSVTIKVRPNSALPGFGVRTTWEELFPKVKLPL